MVNKVLSMQEAVADIFDGAVILVGGFGGAGAAFNVTEAASNATQKNGIRDLVFVVNAPSSTLLMWRNVAAVKKIISAFPVPPFSGWRKEPLRDAILSGEIEIESIPQGTMVERIRAGGAGIPAFFTPVGIGTVVEKDKEKQRFDGRECILEHAIKADFAFIKADKADRWGNLTYRKSQRNFNPVMATAATVTIAEVDEIVDRIDPEVVVTQGIYVERVVCAPKQTLDFRRVMR